MSVISEACTTACFYGVGICTRVFCQVRLAPFPT